MAEKKKGFDLAESLKAVSTLDIGAEGREQIEYHHIENLIPDERNFYALDGVKELAANIELVGLQQPLRVRPGDQDGSWIIVSGHRRRAALQLLTAESQELYERFCQVPCIVERQNGATDEVEGWLQELRLIYGNSDTRKLSSADISKQAERVEMLLYQLKEAGVEFPGKMRDHVAEACKVSASKLARLKVIREGLMEPWKIHYENGSLVESSAYELARLPKEIQVMAYNAFMGDGKTQLESIPTWRISQIPESVKKIRGERCKKRDGERCKRSDERVRAAIKDGYWDNCARCCSLCYKLGACKKVCESCRELAEKKAKQAADEKAREEERRKKLQEEESRLKAWALEGWVRLGKALKSAGMSVEKFAELDDVCWDEDDAAMAKKAMRGVDVSEEWYPGEEHPLAEFSYPGLVELAKTLSVSLDYLLGVTDEPRPAATAAPPADANTDAGFVLLDWFSPLNKPEEGALVALAFDFGKDSQISIGKWEHGEWRFKAGTSIVAEPVGWFPLPPLKGGDAP